MPIIGDVDRAIFRHRLLDPPPSDQPFFERSTLLISSRIASDSNWISIFRFGHLPAWLSLIVFLTVCFIFAVECSAKKVVLSLIKTYRTSLRISDENR